MEARYNPPRINPELFQPRLYGTEEEYGIEYPVGYEAPEEEEDIWLPTEERRRKKIREDVRAEMREEAKPKGFSRLMGEANDREAFRSSAIKQLPGQKDPYLRDVHKETRILFDQRIDGLRQHIFKGIPRNVRLTPDQEAHFSQQAQKLYQMCQAETQGNLDMAKEGLSNMMARFDGMVEERKAEGIRMGKETPEQKEAREIRKETRGEEREIRKEKRAVKRKVPATKMVGDKLYQWQPSIGDWEDTGLKKEAKTLSLNDVNKRLESLHKSKVKLQTTKGLDPLTLFLIKDNPEAQRMYKAGDTKAAIAEIDKQIKHYESLRNKKEGIKESKTVVETRTYKGRKIVKYSDGTISYAE